MFSPLKPIFLPQAPQGNEARLRLSWLIRLRWLALGGQLLCVPVAVKLQFLPPQVLGPALGLCFGLLLANGWALQELGGPLEADGREHNRLLVHAGLDLVQFMALLALTGGIANPFYPLLYFYTLLGAIVLPGRSGWAFLVIELVAIYLLNPVLFALAHLNYVRLSALVTGAIQSAVVLSVWGLARWLTSQLLAYRQALASLQEKQQRAQRLQLLEALGAGFSHELATPLNTIRMRLERYKRRFPEQELSDLDKALEATQQCTQALHSLAQVKALQPEQLQQTLQLDVWLRTFIDAYQERYPDFEFHFDLSLPTSLQAELPEESLRQALTSLFDNARLAGGAVQGRVIQQGSLICLELADQGPGWPPGLRQKLGQPFVSTREQGTGLGLYTVNMLADALGGRLELLDNQPKGARVRLCLPLFQQPLPS